MITKRNLLVLSIIAVFATVSNFVSFVHAEMIEVLHEQGRTQISKPPQKVVVFDLASLDNMLSLGLESAIIAVPQAPLPDYLQQFGDGKYEKVGTLFEPDLEAVAALDPDLIIVGGRSQAKYDDLAQIAPTIDLSVDNEYYLGSVERNLRILSRIFNPEPDSENKETDAEVATENKIDELQEAVAQLEQLAATKGRGLLILTTGGKMSAYGPGSRFGILHDDFGVIAAVPDLSIGNHGQPISFEFILETNPDWLFVIDRDAAIGREAGAAAALLDNPVVNKTIAAEKGQIVYLEPQNWYLIGGGLTGLHQTINQIRTAYGQ